ncbi:MAG: phenylalanine--tRNA ligase subunit beta [Ilumatobacteraceae bacterium]
MKIVLSWLNDLAPVGDDVEQLAADMTQLGMQIEEVLHVGSTVDGVVTAEVLRTERHPDAAKVHRVFVSTGDGVERHVWCGAFNMRAGDVIPLATPGTVMPDGREIEPRPILGIDSQGMLCSARELGLGDDHSGILILPAGTPLGVPYGDALGLQTETVFDIDLTRNRPDCWGHRGIARDLGAHRGVALTPVSEAAVPNGPERSASVDLVDGHRCTRFTTIVLSGIAVTSSPDWIKRRLIASGMRPINNVVDVSNYVMLELNQPNHAYDLDTLGGGGLRIRLARESETITTLDGTVRALSSDDLLICDANDTPIGLGGMMGGLDSEITDRTTVVALEIAHFEQTGMTRSMNRLGIRSEASGRNERGVDPYGMPRAQQRFIELLGETCPDLVVHDGAVDVRDESIISEHRPVPVRVSQVNRILGTSLFGGQIARLIDPIGYLVDPAPSMDGDTLTVSLPSWRPDSIAEIDVIEEIARHYGYPKLGKAMPNSTMHGRLSPVQQRRRMVRQVLLGLGLDEAITDTFFSADELVAAGLSTDGIRITNPLIVGQDVLRPSLRIGLLEAIAFNESHRSSGVSLFEIGHVYPKGDGSSDLPPEYESLGIALAGRDATAAMTIWKELVATMGFGARVDQSLIPAGLHPTRSATLSVGRDVVGGVGEIHPKVLEQLGVTERVAWLELDLSRLLSVEPKVSQWKPTSRYPSSDFDLALVAADTVAAERIEKAIRQGGGALLVGVSLFDIYRGPGVPEGSRSLAYRLRVQALDRTLTEAEVGEVRSKVIKATEKLATLRA